MSCSNRLTMSDGTATTAYTYDLNNRLITSTETNNGAVKNTRYSYDYNGNQISKLVTSTKALAEGKGETVKISDKTDENVAFYEYNCYNQVIEADTNGVKSNYAYSPDGLRHSKTVDGNTITFVYDNTNVVEEITQDGTNKYYRGFEIVKNDDNVYYLYNGQGDVAKLIDNTGKTVANYSFDAYGNQSEENTIYNPFGYRGEYQDNETGLIYLRNRYYDSNNGRFITEDPIKDGLNWYVYCGNNPIMFVDPTGNSTSPITMAKEFNLSKKRIGIRFTIKANTLSNKAEKNAINYADKNGYYTIERVFSGPNVGYIERKKYITWDNKVDAKRHMEWNSMMAREIGYDQAHIVANNHELVALRELGVVSKENGSVVETYLYQSYLMDLRNNAIGRNLTLNNTLNDKSYDELFNYALDKNLLITDASKAYDYFGIQDCADDLNRVKVLWNVEDDTLNIWSPKEEKYKYTIRLGE